MTDNNELSQQAHDQFNELVQQIDAQPSTAPVEPNQSDLEWLNNQQSSTKDDTGRRRFETDSVFRERLEVARMRVFSGESIADVRAATERALKGEPEPQPAPEPVEPQLSPEQRASAELDERLNSGDVVDVAELPREMLHGYTISLPQGFGLDQTAVAEIAAARKAGITQNQLDVIISEIVRSQQ